MYSSEQLFEALTYKDLYYTLKLICDEDCWLDEFLSDEILEGFIYMLEVYELVYVLSNERIILSPKGTKVLEYVSFKVELEKNQYKVNKKSKTNYE